MCTLHMQFETPPPLPLSGGERNMPLLFVLKQKKKKNYILMNKGRPGATMFFRWPLTNFGHYKGLSSHFFPTINRSTEF